MGADTEIWPSIFKKSTERQYADGGSDWSLGAHKLDVAGLSFTKVCFYLGNAKPQQDVFIKFVLWNSEIYKLIKKI